MKRVILLLGLFNLLACHSEKKTPDMYTEAEKEAHEQIDVLIAKVFEAICFDKASGPTMYQLKDLFVEDGLLINYNEEEPLILPVAEFVKHFEKVVEDGLIPSLEDREVKYTTEVYDRIAHRFSFYEARFTPQDEPFARGVNSIQLIRTAEGWKVTSMAWNDDSRGDGFFQRIVCQ